MITRRFATVEPVFGNLRPNKRLDRFTLRGRRKVDGQWKLYCMMHNIKKLGATGMGSEADKAGQTSTGNGRRNAQMSKPGVWPGGEAKSRRRH